MPKKIIYGLCALLFICSGISGADEKIYHWTDENGVQHFSSSPPADGSMDVETFKSLNRPEADQNGTNVQREAYKQMLEKQKVESQKLEQAREREKQALEVEKKQKAEQARQAEIQRQKENLQQQIDALNNRGLSPTFPKGMRDSQIEALQKKIELLEKAPDNQ